MCRGSQNQLARLMQRPLYERPFWILLRVFDPASQRPATRATNSSIPANESLWVDR